MTDIKVWFVGAAGVTVKHARLTGVGDVGRVSLTGS
jgi:hypothetical protein